MKANPMGGALATALLTMARPSDRANRVLSILCLSGTAAGADPNFSAPVLASRSGCAAKSKKWLTQRVATPIGQSGMRFSGIGLRCLSPRLELEFR